ncbi:PAS domain-containing protein [Bradyrhizobium sp.]|uniref:PAS domain-containing sensor histidine kinase n=1 Tax=Bradyrhizobium sp. TaxID=376 RepID=UPI003BB04F63
MNHSEFQLRGFSDPLLAVHATSALPVWLWSTDGARILWANPVGADLFGAANGIGLADKTFGPADPHRRQVAQLAGRLPPNSATRMERLHGFGAPPGMLMTCGCARLDFSDGSHGILIVAHTAARTMALAERLRRLVEGIEAPIVAFARDGTLVGASDAARLLLGFRNLGEAGLEGERNDALRLGRVEAQIGTGKMVLQRIGHGADVALVGLIVPSATPSAQVNDIAAAGFELVDEFAERPAETADHAASQPEIVHEGAAPEAPTSEIDAPANGLSPPVEAVTEEPALPSPRELPSWLEGPPPPRQHPLRFVWQIDADGRFLLDRGEFTDLIGSRAAARFNRPWGEIAKTFGLDPDGRVAKAMATQDTWSGITLNWPADGGDRLPVEFTGLPVFDRMRKFAGYRGFGVCRDLDGLTRLAALRRFESPGKSLPQGLSAGSTRIDPAQDLSAKDLSAEDLSAKDLFTKDSFSKDFSRDFSKDSGVRDFPAANSPATSDMSSFLPSELLARVAVETSPPTDLERPVETPPNVVPFRLVGDPKSPALTPVENNAFDELARQLSERLDGDDGTADPPATTPGVTEAAPGPQVSPPTLEPASDQRAGDPPASEHPASEHPDWLAPPEPPARGEAQRDRALLDLLPTGILIYRFDRLLYANPAFLKRIGYASLYTLEQAGGLDALYVEPGVSSASSTSEAGTPMTISASRENEKENEKGNKQATGAEASSATDARLFTISWDGDPALALICSSASAAPAMAAIAEAKPTKPTRPPAAVGYADAEDLAAILDTTAEGVVMFDAGGAIHACNRSAEALFGYDGQEFVQRHLAELFAPESQRLVQDHLAGIKGADVASLLDHGRDVLGRERNGGIIPLSMTIGRTRPGGANFFAVFRDLSQSKKGEGDSQPARRQADHAANAKADLLARISHEVRTPLNAIIGFAEVMIAERFGALGNERYVEYLKDIRSSGEHVIAIINDLLELSRIETGRLDLTFANQNLNDLVESCVAVMQSQANRERIIIRSSLSHTLPPVVADARTLRQIALNLIGNSIHLANAGGQVIVSTALSDLGEVVLRIRDTGPGLNDNEVAAALEPFRNLPPSEQASDGSPVSLSLTKALVEANRAQFHIKTGARSGTLIEVVFSSALARS